MRAGMDLSIYANDVDFRDPITNYDDIEVCRNLLQQQPVEARTELQFECRTIHTRSRL